MKRKLNINKAAEQPTYLFSSRNTNNDENKVLNNVKKATNKRRVPTLRSTSTSVNEKLSPVKHRSIKRKKIASPELSDYINYISDDEILNDISSTTTSTQLVNSRVVIDKDKDFDDDNIFMTSISSRFSTTTKQVLPKAEDICEINVKSSSTSSYLKNDMPNLFKAISAVDQRLNMVETVKTGSLCTISDSTDEINFISDTETLESDDEESQQSLPNNILKDRFEHIHSLSSSHRRSAGTFNKDSENILSKKSKIRLNISEEDYNCPIKDSEILLDNSYSHDSDADLINFISDYEDDDVEEVNDLKIDDFNVKLTDMNELKIVKNSYDFRNNEKSTMSLSLNNEISDTKSNGNYFNFGKKSMEHDFTIMQDKKTQDDSAQYHLKVNFAKTDVLNNDLSSAINFISSDSEDETDQPHENKWLTFRNSNVFNFKLLSKVIKDVDDSDQLLKLDADNSHKLQVENDIMKDQNALVLMDDDSNETDTDKCFSKVIGQQRLPNFFKGVQLESKLEHHLTNLLHIYEDEVSNL